jgi:hypothetical protein
MRDGQMQGEILTPARAVLNCYDMDDFPRPKIAAGNSLVGEVIQKWRSTGAAPRVHASFSTWSHIAVGVECPAISGASSCLGTDSARTQVTLRQAYHEFWKAPGCTTYPDAGGRLVVDCPASRLRDGPLSVAFDDTTSDLAAGVSRLAWQLWMETVGTLLLGVTAVGIVFRTSLSMGSRSRPPLDATRGA